MLNVSGTVVGLCLAMLGIHFNITMLNADDALAISLDFSFIPAEFARWAGIGLAPVAPLEEFTAETDLAAFNHVLAAYFQEHPSQAPWTLVTHAFFHAGWTHVIVNAVWLLAFGGVVARPIGGALAHFAVYSGDFMPMMGASGAISGLMGAASRFIFQPSGPVLGGIRLGPKADGMKGEGALLSLKEMLRNPASLRFIGLWMLFNLLVGVLGSSSLTDGGNIAWIAHLGGFVAGVLTVPLLDNRKGEPVR
jgi:membrane associated rhomboid family serine protease